MKLATISVNEGNAEIGLIMGDQVVRLREALPGLPHSMLDLIAAWETAEAPIRGLLNEAQDCLSLESVRLLAPIRRPGKIMAIGLNYADHVAEANLERPTQQVWFCKQPNTIHPPFAPVQIPKVSSAIDYEVELVAVIGKGGRHIARDAVAGHVFGYCVGNDVTVRDWQFRTPQWVLGKSFDTHCPFGPWITTADEIGDPHRLDIRAAVNGEVRQQSNTRELIFDVYDQIAYLSEAMTLEAGDIILTGTPGGVGAAMKPPAYLKAGDRVRCEIEELGAIDAIFEPEP